MRILFVLLPALLLAGCVAAPKTAAEFRQNVSSFIIPKVETFEVNRPFKDVVETFRKLAPKCLDVTIQSNSRGVVFNNWTPTLLVSPAKAELHVQLFKEKQVRSFNNPDKGEFMVVADMIPAGAQKTGITLYMSFDNGVENVARAIKGWAAGTSTACADMTKL